MLWHIMTHYASYGHNEFLVALGYKGEVIKDYFLNYYYRRSSLTIDLASGEVRTHGSDCEDWRVHLIDTGQHTNTGGRVKRLKPWVGRETFMLTYGDGVGDVDLQALMAFHRRHQRLATITAVRPPARFGSLDFLGDQVIRFVEKPQAGEGWINGGFFVLEPEVLDLIQGDDASLERDTLEYRLLAVHGYPPGCEVLGEVVERGGRSLAQGGLRAGLRGLSFRWFRPHAVEDGTSNRNPKRKQGSNLVPRLRFGLRVWVNRVRYRSVSQPTL
jgi:glucose-1-phosphate cytidylyltransferase